MYSVLYAVAPYFLFSALGFAAMVVTKSGPKWWVVLAIATLSTPYIFFLFAVIFTKDRHFVPQFWNASFYLLTALLIAGLGFLIRFAKPIRGLTTINCVYTLGLWILAWFSATLPMAL